MLVGSYAVWDDDTLFIRHTPTSALGSRGMTDADSLVQERRAAWDQQLIKDIAVGNVKPVDTDGDVCPCYKLQYDSDGGQQPVTKMNMAYIPDALY